MVALTKSEMAERLFEELGLNKREAKEIVELFFEEIRGCLENNEQVKLSGFGNFDLRDKSQRPGRNPKTGEEIPKSRYLQAGSEAQGASRSICWNRHTTMNYPQFPANATSLSVR